MSLFVRALARTHCLPSPRPRFLQPHTVVLTRRAQTAAARDQQRDVQPQQLCQQLAAHFGISWAGRVQEGPYGLGIFPLLDCDPGASHLHAEALGTNAAGAGCGPPLVKLPACLAISNDQGTSLGSSFACPTSAHHRRILNGPLKGCSWEIQIGFLLTWLLQQPAAEPAAAFWQQYSQLLPPHSTRSCLLCWNEAELQLLQDDALMQEVVAWQEEVRAAYNRCCAAHAWSASDGPSSGTQMQACTSDALHAAAPTAPTLETFEWAVAAVQSRAFAFEAEGTEVVALLPYFDLFNHSLHPTCSYVWDPQQQVYRMLLNTSSTDVADQVHNHPGTARTTSSSSTSSSSSSSTSAEADGMQEMPGRQAAVAVDRGRMELTISYGQKSNRKLMEQYGFVVAGNHWDRLSFQGLELPAAHDGRRLLSHTAVRAAAAALSQGLLEEQQQQQQRQQQQTRDDTQVDNCHQGTGAAGNYQAQLVRVQCAAASVLAAAGWRRKAEYEAVTTATTRQAAQALMGWVEQQQATLAEGAVDRAPNAGGSGVVGTGPQSYAAGAAGCSQTSSERLVAAAQYVCERAALLQATHHLLQQVLKP